MYAVVNIGGKQAKVEEGSLVTVEKLDAAIGETVTLPVLTIVDNDTVSATPSEVASACVSAEVVEHGKGEKQIVFKFKKRKGYKRTKGHRQDFTMLRVLSVSSDGSQQKKVAAKASKSEKAKVKAAESVPAEASVVESTAKTSAEPVLCAAIKSDGTPCTNKAKEGSRYCGVHAKKYEG